MDRLDKLLEDLAHMDIYVNKDKLNLARYYMYDDGTEIYVLYFDNYKIYIKILPNRTVRVLTYPPTSGGKRAKKQAQ